MADQDPFAEIAKPVAAAPAAPAAAQDADPFASIAKPIQPPAEPGIRDQIDSAISDPSNVLDTGWRGKIERFGQTAAQTIAAPVLHPIKTAQSMLESTPPGMIYDAVTGTGDPLQKQAAQSAVADPAGFAGQVAGGAVVSHVLGGAMKVPEAVSNAKQFVRPSTSPAVVPPTQQAAAAAARAINPPGGVTAGLEGAIADQAPLIKAYAAKTGNPLSTRWELAKAALGHAKEMNDFYDDHVLGPSSDKAVPVDGTGYQGQTRAGKATLGDIDARLGKINDLLRPAYGKMSESAQMTALERSGLQDEANALRATLYNELSKETGLKPEEIQQLRKSFGQGYDIASQADAARRKVGPGGPVPLTKSGLIQSVLEKAVGGPDAAADRGVQSTFQKFQPATSPVDAWKQRVTGFRQQAAAAANANRGAAQNEFLHGTQLDQEAQAASQQRAQHAAALRGTGSDDIKYKNGKAYVVDPKSGWWIPKQ